MSAMKMAENKPLSRRAEIRLFDGLRLHATNTPHGLRVVFWPVGKQIRKKFTTKGYLIFFTNAPTGEESNKLFTINFVSRKKCGREMQRLGFCLIEGNGRGATFSSSPALSRNHKSHSARNELIDKWIKGKVDAFA